MSLVWARSTHTPLIAGAERLRLNRGGQLRDSRVEARRSRQVLFITVTGGLIRLDWDY